MKLVLTMSSVLEASPHGTIGVLDWERREIVDCFRHRNTVYPASNKGISGACWAGDRLLAVTEAELLEFDVDPLRLVAARSLPFLNDCHHVATDGRTIWVCNTGVDTLEEFDRDWTWRTTLFLAPRYGWQLRPLAELAWLDLKKSYGRLRGWVYSYPHRTRRPPFRNLIKLLRPRAYRKGQADLRTFDFRPHVVHVNHALPMGDDVWLTLWATGQIVSLRSGQVLAEGLGWPHDGLIVGDRLLVTDCKHNRLFALEFDPQRRTLGRRVAERVLTSEWREGFVRGLAVVDGQLFVGLTVNRGAQRPEWRTLRIRRLNLDTFETLDEWSAPTELGLGVYSILPFPG